MKGTAEATSRPTRESVPTRKPSRIQRENRGAILDAALSVFSVAGFRGATIDRIAEKAGMSKPNVLYYFPSKQAIYVAVLERTLADWLQPLADLDPSGDPITELGRYLEAKLEMSRTRPDASKLFANEILHGAPAIAATLEGPLKTLVDEKAAVLSRWIAEGRLAAVDPHHLIFAIWAVTQHYADFDVQVRAVLGTGNTAPARFADARRTLVTIFLQGLSPADADGAARLVSATRPAFGVGAKFG